MRPPMAVMDGGMKRRNTDVPECAFELLSRFEFDQVHVYEKKFRKVLQQGRKTPLN